MDDVTILSASDDDPEYSAAFRRARDTIPQFEQMFTTPYKGTRKFMFKAKFIGMVRPIYLWLDLIEVARDSFVGKVFESPEELPSIDVGSRHRVKKLDVFDWMVNDNGKVYGGYTLLVERNRMHAQARAEFDDLLMATSWELL